jgi:hypothetical protein
MLALRNEYPSLSEQDIANIITQVRERESEFDLDSRLITLMMQTSNLIRQNADDGTSILPRCKIMCQRLVEGNEELENKISEYNRYISLNAWRDFERNLPNYRSRYERSRAQRVDPQSDSFWYFPNQDYPQTVGEFTNLLIENMEKWYGPKLYPNVSDLNNAIAHMQQSDVTYRMGAINRVSIYSFIGLL